MGVVRGVLEKLEYTTQNPFEVGSPTYIEIPINKVMQDQSQYPEEVPQDVTTINGALASGGHVNNFAFPVALQDSDTFLSGLQDAQDNLTPVWFRMTPKGTDIQRRVIGDSTGCLIRITLRSVPPFGDLTMAIIMGSVTGVDSGDTIVKSGGS